MDAKLNFLTAPVSNPTSVGASSGSGGLDPNLAKPMNGQEFAGVMRDLMAKGERQELASYLPRGQPCGCLTSRASTSSP